MKKVQSITFVFENCESIEFPVKYIGLIYINDITQNIKRISLNSVKKIDVAKELFVEIFSEGDEKYNQFCAQGKFERLMYHRDIVFVEVHYDDYSTDTIYVDYEGDMQNANQDNYLSNLGNLYISISHRKQVYDFILEKEANNAAVVNLRKPVELTRAESPELLRFVGVESA